MDLTIFFQFLFIFLATIGFSVVFNVNRKELIVCGFIGVVCYVVYYYLYKNNVSEFFSVVVGSLVSTTLARCLTYIRKMPMTFYLIPSLIPLAPGGSIYNAMTSLINNDLIKFYFYGMESIKIAGALTIGIAVSLFLPQSLFSKLKGQRS